MKKPKLIVFDLDYTLWPFWVDVSASSPFKKDKYGKVIDDAGRKIAPFPEVTEVLSTLTKEGYLLGVASRTEWPDGAKKLVELFDWQKYFTYSEIYPGKKTTHFQRIREASGIEYSDMMFFDDEPRNIFDLKAIGVTSILVSDGVTMGLVQEALRDFSRKTDAKLC